jgi:hypothetical protein
LYAVASTNIGAQVARGTPDPTSDRRACTSPGGSEHEPAGTHPGTPPRDTVTGEWRRSAAATSCRDERFKNYILARARRMTPGARWLTVPDPELLVLKKPHIEVAKKLAGS